MTLFDTDMLVEVVNDRIDLDAVALKILKSRGLDKNRKWVGFGKYFSAKHFLHIFYLYFCPQFYTVLINSYIRFCYGLGGPTDFEIIPMILMIN